MKMQFLFQFSLLIALFSLVKMAPVVTNETHRVTFVEELKGDILVRKKVISTKVQLQGSSGFVRSDEFTWTLLPPPTFVWSEEVIESESSWWQSGAIAYVIEDSLKAHTKLIEKALKHIAHYTCVRFREKHQLDKFYVRIFKGKGCYATVGFDVDFPVGQVSLGDDCYYMGTIVHELMHVLGFYHAHNRHDRQHYLKLHEHNIQPDQLGQFEKNDPRNERIIGPFDYNSIMLYGPRAFSKDNTSLTMEPALPGFYMIEVYEKPGLTRMDAQLVNWLYKNCTTNLKDN